MDELIEKLAREYVSRPCYKYVGDVKKAEMKAAYKEGYAEGFARHAAENAGDKDNDTE